MLLVVFRMLLQALIPKATKSTILGLRHSHRVAFDLDAIGVIHNTNNAAITENEIDWLRVYPNPAKDFVCLSFRRAFSIRFHVKLLMLMG